MFSNVWLRSFAFYNFINRYDRIHGTIFLSHVFDTIDDSIQCIFNYVQFALNWLIQANKQIFLLISYEIYRKKIITFGQKCPAAKLGWVIKNLSVTRHCHRHLLDEFFFDASSAAQEQTKKAKIFGEVDF
jgi:hypothetical protein